MSVAHYGSKSASVVKNGLKACQLFFTFCSCAALPEIRKEPSHHFQRPAESWFRQDGGPQMTSCHTRFHG
jgi:hypothetical protein